MQQGGLHTNRDMGRRQAILQEAQGEGEGRVCINEVDDYKTFTPDCKNNERARDRVDNEKYGTK